MFSNMLKKYCNSKISLPIVYVERSFIETSAFYAKNRDEHYNLICAYVNDCEDLIRTQRFIGI